MQTALKTLIMYSANHPAAERALQQAHSVLLVLGKLVQQFTLGFLNQRVLLNNLLTTDNSLEFLEAEFARRGIGAVTFAGDISYGDFKRGLTVLAAQPAIIEEAGGIMPYWKRDPARGMRVTEAARLFAPRGDTFLGSGGEAYVGLPAGSEGASNNLLIDLDFLLATYGGDRIPQESVNWEALKQVIREALTGADYGGRNPMMDLARMMELLSPEKLVSLLPPDRQQEWRGRSARDLAAELTEDIAVGWAAQRLGRASGRAEAKVAEQEVVRGLSRGVRAPGVAERLLQKLARILKEAQLPEATYERLRDEVLWQTLPLEERQARLLDSPRFDESGWTRLVSYLYEAMGQDRWEEAVETVRHQIRALLNAPAETRADGLARLPEILRTLNRRSAMPFLAEVAGQLGSLLVGEEGVTKCHQAAARCLATLARIAGQQEDYPLVQRIGQDLERSGGRDREAHADCCTWALSELLPAAEIERTLAAYLEDREGGRLALSLLRLVGEPAAEIAWERLEAESVAAQRIRLIRLLGHLGPRAWEPTQQRLSDERWYVVRNACYVLAESGVEAISPGLRAALQHDDVRVQEAALRAVLHSHAPDRAGVVAESLTHLHDSVLDTALNELAFLRDPSARTGLLHFLTHPATAKIPPLEKAVRALAAISGEETAEVLGRVMTDPRVPEAARRAAAAALQQNRITASSGK